MARILSGKEVAAALGGRLGEEVAELERAGTFPALAILRVGARDDACAYERGARKRCESVGISVVSRVLPETCSQGDLMAAIDELSINRGVVSGLGLHHRSEKGLPSGDCPQMCVFA